MEKMRFHWAKGEETGSFTVTAQSVDICIKIAKQEIEKNGAELMDWHSEQV